VTPNRLRTLLPALLGVIVPTVGYYVLHAFGMNDVWALTVAGSATGVLTLANTVRRRRLDALGLLVIAEIALAIVLNLTVHDPG
jgi:hypothetical protein